MGGQGRELKPRAPYSKIFDAWQHGVFFKMLARRMAIRLLRFPKDNLEMRHAGGFYANDPENGPFQEETLRGKVE